MVTPQGSFHLGKDWRQTGTLVKREVKDVECDIQAMVVFILPTFVSREIFANSTAKAGVSSILSLMTFEHLAEL